MGGGEVANPNLLAAGGETGDKPRDSRRWRECIAGDLMWERARGDDDGEERARPKSLRGLPLKAGGEPNLDGRKKSR